MEKKISPAKPVFSCSATLCLRKAGLASLNIVIYPLARSLWTTDA